MPSRSAESPQPPAPPPALVWALRRVLRPLVRLLLDHQVTFPLVAGLLKEVYVEVAEREFALEGRPQTTTRVHLLTGIHRKDVKRLREGQEADETAHAAVSLGSQLVARWMGSGDYTDETGRPLPLPRHASAGYDVSFERLVVSVSKDIRPRAVLDEWLRLGVAHLDDQDRVVLNVAAFVPERGFDEKAYFFGHNVHDHVAAAVHNLRGGAPAMPERSVFYDALGPDSIRELQELGEQLGMRALHDVNRRALELQQRDAGSPEARQRMRLGFYFFRGPMERQGGDEEPS